MTYHETKKNGKKKFWLNEDAEMVEKIREGLKRNDGYCPCRLEKTPETKCMCQEFREQLRDDEFSGYCHCLLYYKPPVTKENRMKSV